MGVETGHKESQEINKIKETVWNLWKILSVRVKGKCKK